MNDPDIQANPQKLVAVSKEAGKLEPVVNQYEEYRKTLQTIEELTGNRRQFADPEMAAWPTRKCRQTRHSRGRTARAFKR